MAALLENAIILNEAKRVEEEEITRLEMSLLLAREKNKNTNMKQATVEAALLTENKASEVLYCFE